MELEPGEWGLFLLRVSTLASNRNPDFLDRGDGMECFQSTDDKASSIEMFDDLFGGV